MFLHRRHYEGERVGNIPVKGRQYGIRWGSWKYIEAPEQERRELYDLEADPGERSNRLDSDPEQAARLAQRLARWQEEQGVSAGRAAGARLGPEERRALEALGYVE